MNLAAVNLGEVPETNVTQVTLESSSRFFNTLNGAINRTGSMISNCAKLSLINCQRGEKWFNFVYYKRDLILSIVMKIFCLINTSTEILFFVFVPSHNYETSNTEERNHLMNENLIDTFSCLLIILLFRWKIIRKLWRNESFFSDKNI